MLFSWKNPLKALPILLLLATYASTAFGAAGNAQFVIGDVKLVTKAGVSRALKKGDAVNEGDRIVTAASSSAQIKMVDGGFIAVRPNTDMGFDTYRYNGKEDGQESAIVSLLRGGFRTITGFIGRTNKQNYLIKTATATIGIRGTDHEPMVVLPPAAGQAAIAEPGTYDKVNVGVAFIRTDGGSIDIQRNQVGFAPVTKAAPVILPKIPPFYKPTPEPVAQKAQEESKEGGKQETAAAAPAENAAEASGEIRETAVVDPKSSVAAAPDTATTTAPAVVAPVITTTATGSSGDSVNLTTQIATTSTGEQTSIGSTTTPTTQPPPSNQTLPAGNYLAAVVFPIATTGGFNEGFAPDNPLQPSTSYQLDSGGNLINADNMQFQVHANQNGIVLTPSITGTSGASIKWSGGTAADTIKLPDSSIFAGRWVGSTITVTDNSAPSSVFTYTPTNSLWAVVLPPPAGFVQTLTGTTTYTLAGNTTPVDAFGNLGTLNSASLAANFTNQTVDAAVNLTMSTGSMAGTYGVSATAMPIDAQTSITPSGFGVPDSSGVTTTCTGACAAGAYSGDIGGSFAGAGAASAGLSYNIWPTTTSTAPATNSVQGLVAFTATTAPTVGSTTPTTQPPPVDVINFSSSAVLRNEVNWDSTQIAPGVNPAATTYIVSDKSTTNLFNNASGTPDTPLSTPSTTPVTLTGATVNTNFLFDSSGNLTGVLDTPHVVFDHGNDVPGSRTQFAIPTPLAHAKLSFSGGTAAESYFDPATSIRFGRWSGGVVNVTDLSTGTPYVESLLAPDGAARSLQWVVAQVPSSLPLTGVFQYTRIGDASGAPSFATAPTDSYGNVGTLEGARLSADFTNNTASAAVRITMPSGPAGSLGTQNLSSRFDNAPISNGGFNVSSGASGNPAGTDNLHIACFGTGCAPDIATGVSAYGGRIRGGFDSASGNAGTADGAFFRYTFNTIYGPNGVTPPAGRVVDDYINGLVAFKQGPEIVLPTSAAYPVAAPVAPVVVTATYSYFDGTSSFNSGGNFWTDKPQGSLVTDAAGNLISIKEPQNSIFGDNQALELSGGLANPATPTALAIGSNATATDGSILLGWQAPASTLTVSGIDFNDCFGTGCSTNPVPRTVLGDGVSWVRGPAPFPFYLPGAIAGFSNSSGVVVPGTATYNLGTSILHDQTGATGTVNSAGLTVNFNTSSVDFDMQATTAAGNWVVSAPGIRLDQEGSFNAHAGNSSTTISSGNSVLPPNSSHDTMSLTLNGSIDTFGNIDGQLMGIGVAGAGVTYNLNGFLPCTSGPCPMETASGALAFRLNGTPYSTLTPYHLTLNVPGMTGVGEFEPSENTRIDGGLVSSYRTQFVNNFPVRVDGQLPILVTEGSPCTINCTFVNSLPVVYTFAGATGAASNVTATVLDPGYDLATGIRWGRYGNGNIGVNDRISGASLGVVDATLQTIPFLITGNQSGPTVLPVTGTFNYTFVGGTAPVDNNGNVGAALTAANASLTANFTAQTVDTTLSNLTVGGNTWGASATGIPITANVFQAETKPGGGGNLTVTSSLGTNTSGQLIGGFTGQTGNGVGMAYSLNHGGNSFSNSAAVTASGVVVFKR